MEINKYVNCEEDCDKKKLALIADLYSNPKSKEEVDKIIEPNTLDSGFFYRVAIVHEYSFALPCLEVLNKMKEIGNILEIGAGTGAWTRLLKGMGVDIIATDKRDIAYNGYFKKARDNKDVIVMDGLEAIKTYSDRNLFMCWPDYDQSWAFAVLERFRSGNYFFYIGEDYGGCTGNDDFHKYISSNFEKIEMLAIPQWYGMHDYFWVYKKK